MPRKSAAKRKVEFQKEFYSDISLPDMIYAVTVRSPVSKGIVKSVSHPDLPEGYVLVTARDVPGTNLVDLFHKKIPLFCEGNVSYPGEPLALLAGPDEGELLRLLDEISVSVDEKTIEDYLPEDSAEKKHHDETLKEFKEKIFSDKIAEREIKFGECFEKSAENPAEKNPENSADGTDEMEKIFSSAYKTIESEWNYALKIPDYGEPNGAVCQWKDNTLFISTPTQWLTNLRKIACQAFSIKGENVTIQKTTSTNRGTNSIWYNSIIACQAAVAAKKTGRPVKLVYSRSEQEKFLNTMQPIVSTTKSAFSEKGEILAIKIKIEMDAGFNNPFAQEIVDRLVIASCGCYSPKNVSVTATARSSANPPSSVDIQLIDSASFFAMENHMNQISNFCNLTPVEVRLRNFLHEDSAKKKRAEPKFSFDIEKFGETMEALSKSGDLIRKYSSYQLDAKNWSAYAEPKEYVSSFSSPMRGIGLACAFEGTGYYGSDLQQSVHSLEVTMESEGVLTIHCLPISKSIHEIWAETAAEILDTPFLTVKINSVFKNGEEPPTPENVYSNVSIMTSLLKKCCVALKKKKSKENFPVTVKKRTSAQNEWNFAEFSGHPFHSTSFVAAAVELEINLCTYREEIRGINVIVNGGKILNTQAATSTIKLGLEKVLSSLLEDDRVECTNLKISFMQSEKDPSQIGELIYQVIPAAYTQALTQALNCTINSLPLTTETLYKKIREEKRRIREQKEMQKKEEAQNENSPLPQ